MSNVKSSALRDIVDKVYTAKDRESGLQIVINLLASPNCPIRGSEASGILMRAKQCTNLLDLQKYLTNSFFRYEGMSCTRRERF